MADHLVRCCVVHWGGWPWCRSSACDGRSGKPPRPTPTLFDATTRGGGADTPFVICHWDGQVGSTRRAHAVTRRGSRRTGMSITASRSTGRHRAHIPPGCGSGPPRAALLGDRRGARPPSSWRVTRYDQDRGGGRQYAPLAATARLPTKEYALSHPNNWLNRVKRRDLRLFVIACGGLIGYPYYAMVAMGVLSHLVIMGILATGGQSPQTDPDVSRRSPSTRGRASVNATLPG